ncbi:hypothetical protein AVEN_13379-1 [Araneus ventricosus]|uniref:Uncharacterized protein n=1 Tax=Araneus ventricosus TaxID=182803 RepID=A0A4Y2UEQ8_ARAVE|nr:hypothetical protein AVEN_13379-1 [Araneus ventricosus]
MDINSLTSDDIMSELFKIWDSKFRSKPGLTDDQGLLAKNLLQALPSAISSSCSISTTSASAPLITSQHQEDNANPRTYAETAKCKGNNSHTILLYQLLMTQLLVTVILKLSQCENFLAPS